MEFPDEINKNGVRMVRIASGSDGSAVRESARRILEPLGKDLSTMPADELVIDVGRRTDGSSFWVVWLKEGILSDTKERTEDQVRNAGTNREDVGSR